MGKRIEEVCSERLDVQHRLIARRKKKQEAMVGGSVRQSERKK